MSCAMRRASSAVVAKPCGDVGMPALATIFRDSYSKNLMGRGSLSWAAMRLAIVLFSGAAAFRQRRPPRTSPRPRRTPGSSTAPPHELSGHAARGERAAARPAVELQAAPYPYKGEFRTLATATTRADGDLRLQAPLRPQHGAARGRARPRRQQTDDRARLRLPAAALDLQGALGSRLRITQFLRTAPNVSLDGPHDVLPRPEEREVGASPWPAPSRADRPAAASRRPRPSSSRVRGRARSATAAASATPRAAAWAIRARSARSATASELRAPRRCRRSRARARRSPAAP